MKKIVLWFATTFSIVVLLFGYRTSTNSTTASAATSAVSPHTGTATTPAGIAASSTAAPSSSGNAVTAPTSTSAGSTANPAAAASTTTYTGDVASTRWGDVQVSITVTDGKITAVDVPVYPTENGKDRQINARALPTLVQETISNQGADIDMVSGATVTSDGYLESLQSALDQAGL